MRKNRILDIPILLIAAMLALCGCEEKTDLVSGFSANELSVAAHRKMLEEAIESYRAFLSGELSVDYKFLSYKGEQMSIDINDILDRPGVGPDRLLYALSDVAHDGIPFLHLRTDDPEDNQYLLLHYTENANGDYLMLKWDQGSPDDAPQGHFKVLGNGGFWLEDKDKNSYHYLVPGIGAVGGFGAPFSIQDGMPLPDGRVGRRYSFDQTSLPENIWSAVLDRYSNLAEADGEDFVEWLSYSDFDGELRWDGDSDGTDMNGTPPSAREALLLSLPAKELLSLAHQKKAEESETAFREFLLGKREAVNDRGYLHPTMSGTAFLGCISVDDVLGHPDAERGSLQYTVMNADYEEFPLMHLRTGGYYLVLGYDDGELFVRYSAERFSPGSEKRVMRIAPTDIWEEESFDGFVSYRRLSLIRTGYIMEIESFKKCDADGDGMYTDADRYWFNDFAIPKSAWDRLMELRFLTTYNISWHDFADFDGKLRT